MEAIKLKARICNNLTSICIEAENSNELQMLKHYVSLSGDKELYFTIQNFGSEYNNGEATSFNILIGYNKACQEKEKPNGGLTPKEQAVMDDLVSAWNKFIKLEKQHPCDNNEFCDGIHKLQGILAMRPLRRKYPDYWKSYKE